MIPVHRNTDSRNCGAETQVRGQSNVFVNNLLCSVLGDPNTHGGGSLQASNNDGTVFVNGILVNLLGSDANSDSFCPIPPHCNPKASSASNNVFACGGTPGPGITNEEQDPTREDLYGDESETTTTTSSADSGSGGGSGGGTSPSSTTSLPNTQTQQAPDVRANQNAPSNIVPPDELANDAAFQAKLDEMIAKYPGLTREEIYQIIQGESGFNTTAVNGSTGATGLFQFMPATARELGYTTEQIQNMSAAEQLEVYDQYLGRWDYNGSNHLGVMQAAPAYASRPETYVAYRRGSPAWYANPGWRPADGGDITVGSINNYYRGQA